VNPHSLIAARLFSQQAENLNLDFFQNKLKTALALRERLFDRPYYRLVFSEGDGLPGLVIDRYHWDFVVQINTAGMEAKIDLIIQALLKVFPDTSSIFLRNDSPIREQEGLTLYTKAAFQTPPELLAVEENGLRFSAPLQGQKTAWFYDHRLNRARLAAYVKEARVLDVFSYLGAFGIHAASLGANTVDCIEASALACDFIRQNAALNHVQDKINIIQDDAFDAMKALVAEKKQYDVIILDPPAFIKKAKDKPEGFIAYQRLNELAFKLLAPNGILFSCSCSMQLSMEDLQQLIKRAAHRAKRDIQILERGHQGPDHPIHVAIPETDYLKAIVVRAI
jgi:23S rRNA (cytosine1962-C5)-methyltransferase